MINENENLKWELIFWSRMIVRLRNVIPGQSVVHASFPQGWHKMKCTCARTCTHTHTHTHTHTLLTVAEVPSGMLPTRWSKGIMSWETPKLAIIWYILFYIKASCKFFLLLHSIFTSYVNLYFRQLITWPSCSFCSLSLSVVHQICGLASTS